MSKYGEDRNGKIEEYAPDHWQFYCGECGLVYARPFVTYQEASIGFTLHLEKEHAKPERGLFEKQAKVI